MTLSKARSKIFLDTSAVFSAILSETGGGRKLFRLGEVGFIQLIVGPRVLWECDQVVRRKVPNSLPTLAYLLELGQVSTSSEQNRRQLKLALDIVEHQPDAYVLAEAIQAKADWFVTHDKTHFFTIVDRSSVSFKIGTPGDVIQALEDQYRFP